MPITDKAKRLIAKRAQTAPAPAPCVATAAPTMPATAEGVGLGVYVTRNRNTAIVAHVGTRLVHFVTMMNGSVELLHWSKDRFVYEYLYRLDGYPLRRAARTYLQSLLEKTDTAVRALRLILAKG